MGDEIILSWALQGNSKDQRCIDCFFAMKKALEQRKDWFLTKFGQMPSFKAGIHFGKVTVGEIGKLKKDIMFSGDVLNATARIQGLCNAYQTDLIVSTDLVKKLNINGHYIAKSLGGVKLKGKINQKELSTIFRLDR